MQTRFFLFESNLPHNTHAEFQLLAVFFHFLYMSFFHISSSYSLPPALSPPPSQKSSQKQNNNNNKKISRCRVKIIHALLGPSGLLIKCRNNGILKSIAFVLDIRWSPFLLSSYTDLSLILESKIYPKRRKEKYIIYSYSYSYSILLNILIFLNRSHAWLASL